MEDREEKEGGRATKNPSKTLRTLALPYIKYVVLYRVNKCDISMTISIQNIFIYTHTHLYVYGTFSLPHETELNQPHRYSNSNNFGNEMQICSYIYREREREKDKIYIDLEVLFFIHRKYTLTLSYTYI